MADWKDRVKQVEFDSSLRQSVNLHLETSKLDVLTCIEDLLGGPLSIKIKWSEYYDAYTCSLTFDKASKVHKGLTYWFVHAEVGKCIRIAQWLWREVLEEGGQVTSPTTKDTNW